MEFLKHKWGYILLGLTAAAVVAGGCYLLFWNGSSSSYTDGLLVRASEKGEGPGEDMAAVSGKAEISRGGKEAGNAEIRNAEVGNAEVGNAEAGNAEARSAEVGKAKARSAEVGKAEVWSTEVGKAEVGNQEAGGAETGNPKVRNAEKGTEENAFGKRTEGRNCI